MQFLVGMLAIIAISQSLRKVNFTSWEAIYIGIILYERKNIATYSVIHVSLYIFTVLHYVPENGYSSNTGSGIYELMKIRTTKAMNSKSHLCSSRKICLNRLMQRDSKETIQNETRNFKGYQQKSSCVLVYSDI